MLFTLNDLLHYNRPCVCGRTPHLSLNVSGKHAITTDEPINEIFPYVIPNHTSTKHFMRYDLRTRYNKRLSLILDHLTNEYKPTTNNEVDYLSFNTFLSQHVLYFRIHCHICKANSHTDDLTFSPTHLLPTEMFNEQYSIVHNDIQYEIDTAFKANQTNIKIQRDPGIDQDKYEALNKPIPPYFTPIEIALPAIGLYQLKRNDLLSKLKMLHNFT